MTKPETLLRGWLRRLHETGRLASARPGVSLEHELAAIAKRLDGKKAVIFPGPGGHAMPVVSGLVSSRAWIAEAMGASPSQMLARFLHAAENPLPCREVTGAVTMTLTSAHCCPSRNIPSTTVRRTSRPAW
jgi:2,5-furandicarboxylate decarboxylase 1